MLFRSLLMCGVHGLPRQESLARVEELARTLGPVSYTHLLITLRRLGEALMERIHGSYRFIVGFNLTLIALGVAGLLPPATSALLHNGSTLGISLRNMTDLLDDEENPRK